MYGSIEARDVWGVCLLRGIIISLVRSRFAEEVAENNP
jgi:hypothetical protein